MKNTIIISLGGSVIIPDKIDVEFLRDFRNLIIQEIGLGHRFFIITGGGKTARLYQNAANQISKLTRDDLDWLGIHSTVLNAHLLRTIFRKEAYMRIINDPRDMKISYKEKIIIASGWTPGWSTDYIAVKIAEKYNIRNLINISNIDYVYDKDPRKYKNAAPLKNLKWNEFRKLVGSTWDPGLNAPFDPVASKLAQNDKIRVCILNNDLENLKRCLNGMEFKGTTIS